MRDRTIGGQPPSVLVARGAVRMPVRQLLRQGLAHADDLDVEAEVLPRHRVVAVDRHMLVVDVDDGEDRRVVAGVDLSTARLLQVRSGGLIGTPAALPPGWTVRGGWLLGPQANVQGANLTGFDLSGLDLSSALLNNTTLTNADLTGTAGDVSDEPVGLGAAGTRGASDDDLTGGAFATGAVNAPVSERGGVR